MRSELARLTPDVLAHGLGRLASRTRRLTPARRRILGAIETASEARLPLRNVMLGVPAEDRHWWKARVPVPREIPAATRFVSAGPLIHELRPVDLSGIGWVIFCGESGPARPAHGPGLARDLRDQCREQGASMVTDPRAVW